MILSDRRAQEISRYVRLKSGRVLRESARMRRKKLMATKWVYLFSEGNATMRNLLGGKGANLAEMTNLGLPVPQEMCIRDRQGCVQVCRNCASFRTEGKKYRSFAGASF